MFRLISTLVDGDVIVSEVPQIGRLENHCVPGRPAVSR